MSGDDIVTIMEALINTHGEPEFLRIDDRTEMTSNTVAHRCRFSAADISFIDPGSPWQNASVESFNGKLRDKLLRIEIFTTLLEAKSWPIPTAMTTITTFLAHYPGTAHPYRYCQPRAFQHPYW